MESSIIKPEGFLSDYIELIYCNKAADFNYQGFTNPVINSEIFYSFCDHFSFANATFKRNSSEFLFISKNQLTSSPVTSRGKHSTCGIILKPWAFFNICAIDGKSTKRLTQDAIISVLRQQFMQLKRDIRNSSKGDTTSHLYSFIKQKILFKELNPIFIQIFNKINSFDKTENKIGDLVAAADISQKTFIKVFKSHVGLNPLKYLQFQAVENSLDKVRNPNLPLSQIALECGFFDQSHFNRIFKSFMLITPNDYRKMHQQ